MNYCDSSSDNESVATDSAIWASKYEKSHEFLFRGPFLLPAIKSLIRIERCLLLQFFSRRPAILKPLRKSHSVVGKYHKSWELFFGAAVDFTARQLNQIESNFVDFMKLFRFQSSRLEHVKLNWAVNVFHFYLHAECRKSDFKSLLITLIFNTVIISHY